MALARHGSGVAGGVRAFASQVHPVFMLPPVATSLFGALLAGSFLPLRGGLHALAVFAGVYTAHAKDGYVDFHVRGEDDDHPLTPRGCRVAIAGATALFFACLAALWWVVGPGAAAIAAPGWVVGYLHAPQMDTNPVTATTGYPLGIALALLGGYYVQAGALSVRVLAFAVVFLLVLSGIKVVDDAQDYDYDRSIAKHTVAVTLGVGRARRLADALMALGLLGVVALAAAGVFPPSTALAALAFAAVAAVARRADAEVATMLLVRGSYVFLAVLLAATWVRPLA